VEKPLIWCSFYHEPQQNDGQKNRISDLATVQFDSGWAPFEKSAAKTF